ncbi:MAG: hypothetical protein H7831_15245 [Magnetococcus sp. WYHC-3]
MFNFRKMLLEGLAEHHDLLDESRLSDVQAAFPDLGNYVEILSKNDPSGNNKYLAWMALQFDNMTKGMSDAGKKSAAEKIINTVKAFHKNAQRLKEKDISVYKSVKDLENVVKSLGSSETQKKKQQKQVAMEGSSIVYEDEDFFIVRPETKEASCHYGQGTRWCISATKSQNYFDSYSKEGKVFYFLTNKNLPDDDPRKKLAFVFMESGEREETYNTPDNRISDAEASRAMSQNSTKETGGDGSSFRLLTTIMEDHLEKNPPDWVEKIDEKMEEIQRNFDENAKSGHVGLYWDHGDESNDVYFSADAFFEIGELKWVKPKIEFDYRGADRKQILRSLSDAFGDNNVYAGIEDADLDDGTLRMQLGTNDRYGVEGFRDTAEMALEVDAKYEEIFNTFVEKLGEAGLITGTISQKRDELLKGLEFENFDIDTEGSIITFTDTLGVNLAANLPVRLGHILSSEKFESLLSAKITQLVRASFDADERQLSLMESLWGKQKIPQFSLKDKGLSKDNSKALIDIIFHADVKAEDDYAKWVVDTVEFLDTKHDELEVFCAEAIKEIVKELEAIKELKL